MVHSRHVITKVVLAIMLASFRMPGCSKPKPTWRKLELEMVISRLKAILENR